MAHAGRQRLLARLRGEIEGLERPRSRRRALPFGIPEIDSRLPWRGLALGAVHEVMEAGAASEHAACAALFTGALLARLKGPVLWCLSRRDLFAPALAGVGLHPDRVIYAESFREAEILPLVEEGLRHRGLVGVVGEVPRLGLTASRRLQLAAEASGVTALILRRWRSDADRASADEPSAALTRWRVVAAPSAPLTVPGVGRSRWHLELLRCKGAEAFSWHLEAPDETGRFALSSNLADRPHPQSRERRAAAG
jgi:protein ImuA